MNVIALIRTLIKKKKVLKNKKYLYSFAVRNMAMKLNADALIIFFCHTNHINLITMGPRLERTVIITSKIVSFSDLNTHTNQ